MAGSPEVVKRVLRCKLQLADTAQSATVLKILQKLNNLDITVDVLAETGIGKTVNSFRKHKEAGELAKSLVKGWKKLIPKNSTSHTEDGNTSESLFAKEQIISDQNSSTNGGQPEEELNNNSLTPNTKAVEHLNEKCHTKKINGNPKRKKEKWETHDEVDPKKFQNAISSLKNAVPEDKCHRSVSKHKKNGLHKFQFDCQVELQDKSSSGCVVSYLEKNREKSKKKSKPSKESSQDCNGTLSHDKHSTSPDLNDTRQDGSSGISSSWDNPNRKRKKWEKESDSGHELSKPSNKKPKIQENSESEMEAPSMSFESYLNYDENALKKDRSRAKKTSKRIKTIVKEQPFVKPAESPWIPVSPKKMKLESPKDLLHIPLPAFINECDKASNFEYLERKVEKEPDLGDLSEDCTVFTGQRLNKKMAVYSGSKTVFLPAMMSLYQQCIRTLQNNINLLYETGGVPFEILEPVLERCTPQQLLRIEECNPVYVGVTDHLWGKHCHKDFKDAKLQQYESWKEMYVRLSEEREKKFQTLAKKINSDHSKKPKGRQVKMAFIHTVAKPPRDVRIKQEIHGTAVQQPQQPRISVKSQESRSRPSNEPAKTSSSTQDIRKKTRVAPMMAKSLKAFKKQQGRRR